MAALTLCLTCQYASEPSSASTNPPPNTPNAPLTMQAGPVGSSRLAPLLQAASLPSEPYSAPHTIRTIRLPSLAPRLPTLPSLMSTLAAQGYAGSATSSPT
ncbi:hypothetical protein PF005_g26999, partial [Phytophthora fragariae]